MKKTFTIQLNTELTIDFAAWGLSDAQQKGGYETKRLVIDHFLEQNGFEEFEIVESNGNSLFDAITDVVKAQKSYLKPLVVHASECYKLMTNPQRKSDELAETTKTWLKEKAVEEVLGLRKKVATKPMIKGTLCEHMSIELYNKVMQRNLKKNDTTKEKHGFIGTPDLLCESGVVEIKTSWDASTFPFFQDEVNKLVKKYGSDWQCRVYMMLFGIERATVVYCLVDTPTETPSGEILLNKCDNWSLHRVDGRVNAKKRISSSETIERDISVEQKMKERYAIANQYYQKYLNEIYYK